MALGSFLFLKEQIKDIIIIMRRLTHAGDEGLGYWELANAADNLR
jgi:hypothetical protein